MSAPAAPAVPVASAARALALVAARRAARGEGFERGPRVPVPTHRRPASTGSRVLVKSPAPGACLPHNPAVSGGALLVAVLLLVGSSLAAFLVLLAVPAPLARAAWPGLPLLACYVLPAIAAGLLLGGADR